MKIIGLLGGTSWPSTPLYYSYLNELVAAKMGGHHSARIILYSIDYHAIKSRYTEPGGWDEIPDLLREELLTLDRMGPDCILICNNTLHKAYDMVADKGIALGAHVVHLVVATAREAQARDYKNFCSSGQNLRWKTGFAKRLRFSDWMLIFLLRMIGPPFRRCKRRFPQGGWILHSGADLRRCFRVIPVMTGWCSAARSCRW